MRKIDEKEIEQLQERISVLRLAGQTLRKRLSELEKICEQGIFLPRAEGEDLLVSLTHFLEEQNAVLTCFQELGLSQTPTTYEELSEQLQAQREQFSLQREYEDAVSFLKSLQSCRPEQQESLAVYQASLPEWGDSALTEERRQEIMENCVLLRRGLDETVSRKKFTLVLQIAQQYGPEIAQGVNFNEITSVQADGNAPIPVDLPLVTEPVPEVEPCLETEPRPAPGPAPAPVPSPEGEVEDVTETKPALSWENLGIQDPASMVVTVDAPLHCIQVKNDKPFGVKVFKREMSTYDRREKMVVLRLAKDLTVVTPEMVAAVSDEDEKVYRSACERLCTGGYLARYELEGEGQFYSLTPKGWKIFSTQEAAELFHIARQRGAEPESIEYSENGVLARIMMLRIPVYFRNTTGEKLQMRSCFLSKNSFLFQAQFQKVRGKKKSICSLGSAGNTPQDFQVFQNFLDQLEVDVDIFLVVGPDLSHSYALAQWFQGHLAEAIGDTPIWYMESRSDVCYQLDDNETVDLSAFPGRAEEVAGREDELAGNGKEATGSVEEAASETEDLQADAQQEAGSAQDVEAERAQSISQEQLEPAGPSDGPMGPSEPTVEQKEQHDAAIWKMLGQRQFCCAAAYLNALVQNDSEAYQIRCQKLAYALNDPLAACEYNSARIFDIYFSDSSGTQDAYIIAAVLRNYFLNQCGYDYQLASLGDAISKLPLLEVNGSLNQVIYQIKSFKSDYHRGIDFYADYRQKNREMFEQTLANIRAEARTLYENNVLGKVKERAPQRRFLETKKLVFSPRSDLAECLNAVQQDRRDFLEVIQDFLRTHYIKDGEDIDSGNIDTNKVELVLDQAWAEAGNNVRLVKRSSDLMGRLHSNLSMQIRRVVTVLCDYVAILSANTLDENDPGLATYRRIRDPLLQNLEQAITFEVAHPGESPENQAAQAVLLTTLEELQQRLDGTYEEENSRYFYLPFLQGDQVLLDEAYMPELQDVSGIPGLSILTRIQIHCGAVLPSLEERFRQLRDSNEPWGDDYGSARLILRYLKSHPRQVQDTELLDMDPGDIGFADPDAFLNNERRDFEEYMELAQSYGQFDNSESNQKESMNQIVKVWCEQTQETHNFGFFHRILEALRDKIQRDAKIREQDILESLKAYQDTDPGWAEQDQARAAVEEILARLRVQNYTAAEDLLNRLNTKDLDTGDAVSGRDYLREFLMEYDVNAAKAGRAGGNLQANLVREHNKDTRGGNHLIESWPKGMGTPPAKIKDLLIGLGFPVSQVQATSPIQGRDHYLVTLSREVNGRKNGYKHPVSAFGSEAEIMGFRVVNIFGRMDASRLIDTFRTIGDAKNTLVLLDYALTLPERRALARKVKTEFYEKTFAVLDRVALVYLASHYSETAINRMLMAVVMPFAADKLYQPNSGQDMPPELFIGRKNELEQIKAASGVNIVYGGRQLGKTALLRKAQKDIDCDENGDRAIWVDIKGKDYREAARKISAALYDEGIFKMEHITEDWDELARDLKNRLRDERDYIPYLLLLIDEADTFIDSCESVKYQPFDALKDVQGVGTGRFKFVVAGLHNLVRFKRRVTLSDNVGLTHLGSLTVTPFRYKEARELLEGPLSYLGFRFPDNPETARLVSTIFTTTNYFPGLLQLYCAKLIETLQRSYGGYDEADTPPYLLNETLIKKVLADESLQQQIRDKFEITITVDKSQDDYYYLVALLTAYCSHNTMQQKGVGADDIIRVASDYEIQKLAELPRDSVEALMDEMQELNILKRLGNDRYRFARFNFLQMMGSVTEIEDKILAYSANQEV